MAVVTRYFSTSAAGAGDGTSWANRAALLPSGNWSSVITGFNFSTDSMKALIGPGLYSCAQTLTAGLFTNAPTAVNPLILAGCDSLGVLLEPPDPSWVSAMPDWDSSGLPNIQTTTSIVTLQLGNTFLYQLKFTATGRNGVVISAAVSANWCYIENSTSNSNAFAIQIPANNCIVKCTGSSYFALTSVAPWHFNTRFEGVVGSSGNRRGVTAAGNTDLILRQCTVVNCGGPGVYHEASANPSGTLSMWSCVVANNGGTGFLGNVSASASDHHTVRQSMITGNGGYGIDAQSQAAVFAFQNRLRDNTSGNFNGMGNYPTDLNNYTTDSDDADDYVDAANGDFRIRYGSPIWGKGFGVADEPASGGGTVVGSPFGGLVVR